MQCFRNLLQKISFRSDATISCDATISWDSTISSCACVLLDANRTRFLFLFVYKHCASEFHPIKINREEVKQSHKQKEIVYFFH